MEMRILDTWHGSSSIATRWIRKEGMKERNFSGRFPVRVSRRLHRELVCVAEAEGISLNRLASESFAATAERHDLLA
jgi:predicted HicB family RNase H-like nuclease